MRRVPSSGLSCFVRTTRARLASSSLGARFTGPLVCGRSAASPPTAKAFSQLLIVDVPMPKIRATSSTGVFCLMTSCNTRNRNSGG
jgi:hypothetical protein